ncbi:hypothetical protein [Streptomyces sp. NPDC048521]|uniref:hypothetical protein n=1 Tax=Streptomyces sp. NPDC048521 TaxID=3365566 RepID=UPI00371EF6E6
MRLRVLTGMCAVLAAVSGCSRAEVCAGVGTEAGVGVLFVHEGYGGLDGASYALCARGRCAKGELRREGVTDVRLPLPHDVDPRSGPIRFRVTREGAARPVIDASADARLVFQSDGCGGGDYHGGLAFTKEGGLTTKVPEAVSDAWFNQLRAEETAPSAPPGPGSPSRTPR